MGFFDFVKSMFGGGAKLEVRLDATEVPVGGILSGQAILTGASKPYPVTSVKVRLYYVAVEAQDDSPVPKIDMRALLDQTLAADDHIGAKEEKTYSFNLQIPRGTQPSAHNVSYECHVLADIPGIKDASGKAKLKVVESGEAGAVDVDDLYARWPALRGSQERPLVDALNDMRYTHSEDEAENDLFVAEPVLARLLREGKTEEVRRAALDTWSTVVGERATKQHVQTLREFMARGDLDEWTLREAIEAAAKFARAGGLEVLGEFAGHDSPEIRKQVAFAIGLHGGESKHARQVLERLAGDPDAGVRAEVFERLGSWGEDAAVLQRIADQAARDPSPDVQQGCIKGLSSAFWRDHAEIAIPAYEHLSHSEHAEVRKTLAYWTASNAGHAPLRGVVERLLADADEDVRHEIAYYLVNADEAARAPFLPRLRHLADADPSDHVRQAAIATLGSWLPKPEVVQYYRGLMAGSPREKILRGIVHGIKFKMDPEYKSILKELGNCHFADVAREARDGFEYREN